MKRFGVLFYDDAVRKRYFDLIEAETFDAARERLDAIYNLRDGVSGDGRMFLLDKEGIFTGKPMPFTVGIGERDRDAA